MSDQTMVARVAGFREVEQLGGLSASWEYNSQNERVYNIWDADTMESGGLGSIVWDRMNHSWIVTQRADGTGRDIKLTSFTAKDEREGVKKALQLFQHLHKPTAAYRVASRFLKDNQNV